MNSNKKVVTSTNVKTVVIPNNVQVHSAELYLIKEADPWEKYKSDPDSHLHLRIKILEGVLGFGNYAILETCRWSVDAKELNELGATIKSLCEIVGEY